MEFKLTEDDYIKINKLFTPYVFYKYHHKEGILECWCTSCNEHFFLPYIGELETPEEYELIHHAKHNSEVVCPRCKCDAIAKQTGKAKTCMNLFAERRVVIIRKIDENRVIAQGLYCYKSYYKSNYLPWIDVKPFRQYDITPNEVVILEKDKYYGTMRKLRGICEPFTVKHAQHYDAGDGYSLIGSECLEETFLKYNQLASYINEKYQRYNTSENYVARMKYLCNFALHPQIEMLQKVGYFKIVEKLVDVFVK